MKKNVLLGKRNIERFLENIVDKHTSISIWVDDYSIVLRKDNRATIYKLEYDEKYGYYKLYKVYKRKKEYIGYVLTSSDLNTTINGIIRKWDY